MNKKNKKKIGDQMKQENKNVLSGADNKRLNNLDVLNSPEDAAYTNEAEMQKHTHVPIPSEADVINAKEWVDNGSRL